MNDMSTVGREAEPVRLQLVVKLLMTIGVVVSAAGVVSLEEFEAMVPSFATEK